MDGLEMVTVTPGITPPVASDTLPLMAPVVAPTACANAGPAANAIKPTTSDRIRSRLMVAPPSDPDDERALNPMD
jgi:hypothetical protein